MRKWCKHRFDQMRIYLIVNLKNESISSHRNKFVMPCLNGCGKKVIIK